MSRERAASWPAVTVAQHLGAKKGAISFTLDDGMRGHLDFAAPLLEQHGFHGTFFIIGDRVRNGPADSRWRDRLGGRYDTSWQEWRDLIARGHEVGNHTWSHPRSLTEVDDRDLDFEVNHAYARLSEELGRAPFSFCYPRQKVDERVRRVVLERHEAAREDYKAYNPALPNFFLEQLNARIDNAIKKRAFLIPVMHIVSGVKNMDGLLIENILRAHLDHTKELSEDLWVATFGCVVRYYRKRASATLITLPVDNGIEIELRSSVEYPDYSEPLTVAIHVRAKSASACCKNAGRELTARPLGKRILVDVVPNSGPIRVQWREHPVEIGPANKISLASRHVQPPEGKTA